MRKNAVLILSTFALMTVWAGCSSGTQAVDVVGGSLTLEAQSGGAGGSQQLWGLWAVAYEPNFSDFSIVPLRHAEFQANVTRFLQPPSSPTHLLSVKLDQGLSNVPAGYLVCDVTLRHPFVGLHRWRGFDVRGIVMGNASMQGQSGDGEIWPALNELRLLNADGYTRWWNPTEFTTFGTIFGYTQGAKAPAGFLASGTVNGYKYFADGLDKESPLDSLNLSQRGTFSVDPGINTRRYELQFPLAAGAPDFRFNYAVTASYSAPVDNQNLEYPVESFAITANTAEAFRIKVTDNGSSAYFEDENTYGGDLKLQLEVFDWQLVTASSALEEIAAITLESPTLFQGQVQVDLTKEQQGSCQYSRVFAVDISDVTPTSVYDQEVLIRVLSAHPETYAPDIPGITGFDYPEQAHLAAYALWEAQISPFAPTQEDCPTEVHENFVKYHLADAPQGYFSRLDSAFQTVGPYAGQLLVQTALGEVRRYDVSQPEPWTGQPYITLQHSADMDFVYEIDVEDYSGRVIIAMLNALPTFEYGWFDVYDNLGKYLTSINVGAGRYISAFDTDEDGDLWIQTWEGSINGKSRFQHYEYLPDAPYYVEDVADELDTTEQFKAQAEVWDIAISYTLDRIYALRGNYNQGIAPYGELYVYDMAPDGTLTFNAAMTKLEVFPGKVTGSYNNWYGALVDGKIDIDHATESTEHCRILAMAQRNPWEAWGHYFVLMDGDLNVIDTSTVTGNDRMYAFSIGFAPDPADRPMFTSGFSPDATVFLAPAPPGY